MSASEQPRPEPDRRRAERRRAAPRDWGASQLRRLPPDTPGANGSPAWRGYEGLAAGSGGLAVEVREAGTTIEIIGSGEWDLAQRDLVQDAMRATVDRRPERVVLDLSGLSFIDTSGIHNVLELRGRCARENIHLVIVPGGRAIQRVFDICGLIETLPFLRSKG